MKRVLPILIAILLLLCSCSKSPSPDASPDDTQVSPSSDVTQSPLPPPASPSPEPSPSASGGDDGEDDVPIGELTCYADGTILAYQPWLEFKAAVQAGRAAKLMISMHRENAAGPWLYYASLEAGTASWSEPLSSNSEAYKTGESFSFEYDYHAGKHALLLDGVEMFSFTYYPIDPAAAASAHGYTPVEELAPYYTWNEALSDGCFVITDKAENMGMLVAFTETFGFDDGSFLRVYSGTEDGGIVITDIVFTGEKACVTTDSTRASSDGGITSVYYDDCELSLNDADGGKELILSDKISGEDIVLLFAAE